jgi:tight adherence protein C
MSNINVQAINIAIFEGICVFTFIYTLAKLLFTWPHLENRTHEIGINYGTVNSMNAKVDLNNQFWSKKKKKEAKKISLAKRFSEVLLKNSLGGKDVLKVSFEQAGWTSKDVQSVFIESKLACFLMGLAIGYIIVITVPYFMQYAYILKWLLTIFIGFFGWLLPDIYLRGVIKNRVQIIERQFPDALDLVVICLQAGLNLNRAIERVAREFATFGKEVARELMLTSIELEILLDRRQALHNLQSRVPSATIRSFSMAILQSIQQGTPILQSLDVLSKEIRDTRMQNAENKAAKLPSLMVIPLVVFVMPNLFIVLLGPSIVRFMRVT